MPESTSKITANGLLLCAAVLAILLRLVWAYATWPLACLPLAVWVVMVILRGAKKGLSS